MRSPPFFYPPSQFRYRGCDKPSLRLLELIQRATLGTKHTLIWKSCTLRDKILLPRWTLSGHQMSSTLSLPTRLMANAFDQAVRISDGSIPKYWYSWDTIYMKKIASLQESFLFSENCGKESIHNSWELESTQHYLVRMWNEKVLYGRPYPPSIPRIITLSLSRSPS